MGYDYKDAWNDLFALFKILKPNEEIQVPFSDGSRGWIRNKMLDIEKNITIKKIKSKRKE